MSDALTITGKLIEKLEIQTIKTKKGTDFTKQEFIVETSGDYPQPIKFTAVKENVMSRLNSVALGSEVEVSFNVRGFRGEKNGKVFYINDLQAWRVFTKEQNTAKMEYDFEVTTDPIIQQSDDLPF